MADKTIDTNCGKPLPNGENCLWTLNDGHWHDEAGHVVFGERSATEATLDRETLQRAYQYLIELQDEALGDDSHDPELEKVIAAVKVALNG